MNHDELVAKIDNGYLHMAEDMFHYQSALRAVVNLHKPRTINAEMTYCEGCSNSAFFPWKSCPTIETIKEELK